MFLPRAATRFDAPETPLEPDPLARPQARDERIRAHYGQVKKARMARRHE
jgi:hypothetical protein